MGVVRSSIIEPSANSDLVWQDKYLKGRVRVFKKSLRACSGRTRKLASALLVIATNDVATVAEILFSLNIDLDLLFLHRQ